MIAMGQSDYVFDTEDFEVNALLDCFEKLNASKSQAKQEIAACVASC